MNHFKKDLKTFKTSRISQTKNEKIEKKNLHICMNK
jgi:hypothetical protein